MIRQEAEEGVQKGYRIEKIGSLDKEKIQVKDKIKKKTKCNFVFKDKDLKENIFENLKKNGIIINTNNYNPHKRLYSNLLLMRLKFENIISTKLIIDGNEYYYNLITVIT